MGCFGIFGLLRKKSKQAPSTPGRDHKIYIISHVPVQTNQHPVRVRTELYESSRLRVVRNDFDVPQTVRYSPYRPVLNTSADPRHSRLPRRTSNDPGSSSVAEGKRKSYETSPVSRQPRQDSPDQNIRDMLESYRAQAPHIDEDFLWRDRRDSFEEESILAARGQRPPQVKPRRHCTVDCLCSRCLAQLFKEHKRSLIHPNNTKPQRSFSTPSRIPGPSASTRRDSSSSRSSRSSSANSHDG